MSILDGLPSTDHTNFSGPNLLSDEEDVRSPHGLLARDVEYTTGQVRTRRGFATAFTPNSPTGRIISSMVHWATARFNRLLYFCPDEGKVYQRNLLSTAEVQVLSSISALGATFARAGYRLYLAFYRGDTTTGSIVGAAPGYSWDGAEAFQLFGRPLTTTDLVSWDFTEPNSGVVTAGRHYFGLIIISKTGHETRPGPANSAAEFDYNIAPTFVSSGDKNLNLAIRAVWPTHAAQVHLIMTPETNPNRWFKIPGAIYGVPGGSDFTINATINLSDVTLTGTAASDLVEDGQFDILTQDGTGLAPIEPSHVAAFNRRMVYVYEDLAPDGSGRTAALLISDPSNPERLSRARHQIYLPEFRPPTCLFTLGGILYTAGPSYTYAFSDNGAYPVQWSEPRTVSGSIGTPFPEGVAANEALNYAWVADSGGLYHLEAGVYPSLPASNLQTPEWRKINFSAPPNALKVIEDPGRRLVMVAVPHGPGQSIANRLMVWDFSRGTTPDKIRYCGHWHIADGQVDIGALALVINPTNAQKEVWLAPATVAGSVLRQKYDPLDGESSTDTLLYSDDVGSATPVGIKSYYRFGPLFPITMGPSQLIALGMRLRGLGPGIPSIFSLDQTNETALPPIPELHPGPGRLYVRGCNKQSEGASFQISNSGEAGTFFILSLIRAYWQRWMDLR
jgi:hypothetical protein